MGFNKCDGLGLLDPTDSPKSVSKCLWGWRSSGGQTADLYMILLDEESRSLWVIASPTCPPKPTQEACFSSLVEGKDWLWDA